MRTFIYIIVSISLSWCIGIQGLIIPENSYVLSTAGTGIASGEATTLNPAVHSTKKSFVQFSLNKWLGDIKGSHTAYHFGQYFAQSINIQTWNANDIQLWGDKPDSKPLGTFGIHYISAAYSISHDLNSPYRFGLRIETNYSHLFVESMSGMTLDIGILIPINSFMTSGLTIRNFGYEYSKNLRVNIPVELGAGTKLDLPYKISILTDAIYLSNKGLDIRLALIKKGNWLNFNLGASKHDKRIAHAIGFSFNYRKLLISYGLYNHENSELGLPQFFDVRLYL